MYERELGLFAAFPAARATTPALADKWWLVIMSGEKSARLVVSVDEDHIGPHGLFGSAFKLDMLVILEDEMIPDWITSNVIIDRAGKTIEATLRQTSPRWPAAPDYNPATAFHATVSPAGGPQVPEGGRPPGRSSASLPLHQRSVQRWRLIRRNSGCHAAVPRKQPLRRMPTEESKKLCPNVGFGSSGAERLSSATIDVRPGSTPAAKRTILFIRRDE